jgi:hypothetical protein
VTEPSTPTRRTAAEDYPVLAHLETAPGVPSLEAQEALAEIDRLRAAVSSPPADAPEMIGTQNSVVFVNHLVRHVLPYSSIPTEEDAIAVINAVREWLAASSPEREAVIEAAEIVRPLIIACDRMLDNWAEGDEAVRGDLWRNLHTAAAVVAEELNIYPHPSEVEMTEAQRARFEAAAARALASNAAHVVARSLVDGAAVGVSDEQ